MQPTDAAAAVRDEIAGAIQSTLVREARRNEATIANVRAGLLLVASLIEVYWTVAYAGDPESVGFAYRLPILLYLPVAVGMAIALRRGLYHPAIPFALPLLDMAVVGVRFQASFGQRSLESLGEQHELATVLGAAAALVLTGAFRLSQRGTYVTIALGIVLYSWFAFQVQLLPAQLVTHLILLGAVGGMAVGLTTLVRSAVRSEVARLTLGRLLPAHVIDGAHSDPVALLTRPRSVDATILVSDIRGFTSWAERRSPIEVLGFLNVVQGALADVVREHEGTVDKFMGDGMLAVFGAPQEREDHARQAVAAARKMQAVLAGLEKKEGNEGLRIGIGVHSGEVVVGCLGSGIRMEFTVLGDTVNTASRLESMTKDHGVPVLISADTRERLDETDGLRRVADVAVRGREEHLELFTLDDAET